MSNVWMGVLPKEWKIDRIKSVLSERNEKNDPIVTDNILSLTAEKGVILYSEKKATGNKAKDDLSEYKVARVNDIVINSMNIVSGSVGISNYFGCLSPVYYTLVARKGHNPNYYNFVFQTKEFQRSLFGLGNGIIVKESESSGKLNTVRMRIPIIKLNSVEIPIPPFETQNKIVEFLTPICKKIDFLKEQYESIIVKLKEYKKSYITEMITFNLTEAPLKDTEIQWVPKIPEHWEIKRGKNVLVLLDRPVRENDGVITCFRDGEVTLRSNRRTEGFTFSEKEIGYQGIEPGDLVVHGMDGFAGAIGISDSRGKSSPVLNVLDSKENKEYIMYYLRSMAFNDVFTALSTGIRIRTCDLRWTKLATLPYILPPREEQDIIVKKIKQTCSSIDILITKYEEMLDRIENYKKITIYEYVTGKKEV